MAPARRVSQFTPEPSPIDRYIVLTDDEVERAVGGAQDGQRLLFWYFRDAKQHCQELADGGTGFTQSTEKQTRAIGIPLQIVVPYPTKDEIIAAVRVVTPADGRTWPIVDQAWEVLATSGAAPSAQAKAVLET